MAEYVMIPFHVNEDKIEEIKQVIKELIVKVKENEPGVLLYQSMQLKNDKASFIHLIIFKDNDAHLIHRKATYVMDFVKNLYSFCPHEPTPVFLESLDACGSLFEAMQQAD
ncbi:MAG: antibiotic biosynthesis monooxygenase [Nitrospira sp.]|nr:antibiotic biosynthesis monooxygenase [bacterium]MBL7050141.1 antibiotic biosynthesis monooxygenase [Nitrospira sp.]